jgi:predicted  nucleic acid-binding Zn-ribbon protein
MLTKNDLKEIGHLVTNLLDTRFENFAVMMQNEFKYIHTILETKTDKSDLEDFKIETRNNFTEIRSDITEIKTDISDLKLDVADIKYDFKKLAGYVGTIGSRVYKLEN